MSVMRGRFLLVFVVISGLFLGACAKTQVDWLYGVGIELSHALSKISVVLKTAETWEPSKHYIYTITVNGNEIVIVPTVDDWTSEVPLDKTVQ